MNNILIIILIFLIPLLINTFEKKIKLIQWLSPVVCCYAAGMILGNLPFLSGVSTKARMMSEVSLMLALPMLLFATDFLGWLKLAKTTIISFSNLFSIQ